MADFKLPDLGEGVTEAEIDRWLVKEGDTIAEDEPLVDVITDKATAEIPSPYSGVVTRIHVPEGEVAQVGAVLISIGQESGATTTGTEIDSTTPGIKAMPPVRKLARELGVDLAEVRPTGRGGSVSRADVEGFAASRRPTPPERPSAREGREPLRGIRRTIAERMTQAHRLIPSVTHVEECDVTELDATRRLYNERSSAPIKLTFMPFIVKAAIAGLREFPALNSSLDDDAQEIVYHSGYHVGIAVDTSAGLVVPVIRDADKKTLLELASDIARLAAAARDQKLEVDDLRGATFTVTSPGPFGGLMATPIIFHPQAAILGVHRAVDRPVARNGQIVIRKMMNLSVTFDHRILDGLAAAKFAARVVGLLEHPALSLIEPR
jgi:pyruvate/2-oxoglutarate dehydrogenase complex dihydrolipoamide acyltransferase (E2) component